jgi:amidase
MDLFRATARQTVALLRKGEVTPLELIDVAAKRIAETDGAINALPTLCLDRARAHARRIMKLPKSEDANALFGLPFVVKDLNAVAGVRWTEGSRVFAERIADRSDIMVDRLEQNGGIVIGKSNTPEFGAGGNTVNDVFGATRNPWNVSKTTGGSSGGSAAAVAIGQAWLATGNDMAGSIRIPSAFCSVVGLRPSPGRVAHGPLPLSFGMLNVDGPIARNVGDAALMLDAMVGEHPEDPISLASPPLPFVNAVDYPRAPKRIAWSSNLGLGPVEPEIAQICQAAVRRFESMGVVVEEACPDFTGAELAFQILRNAQRAAAAGLLKDNADLLSPEVVHYTKLGLAQTAEQIAQAELTRSRIFQRMADFYRDYDILATPTVMTRPFDINLRHMMEVNGTRFTDYFAWLVLTYAITITACPAISVPCGFTRDGLPVGLQLIGRPRGEAEILSAAALLEIAVDFVKMLPIDPKAAPTMEFGQ